ncbi:hypothetical protein D3C81_1009420 [compost metagenome]
MLIDIQRGNIDVCETLRQFIEALQLHQRLRVSQAHVHRFRLACERLGQHAVRIDKPLQTQPRKPLPQQHGNVVTGQTARMLESAVGTRMIATLQTGVAEVDPDFRRVRLLLRRLLEQCAGCFRLALLRQGQGQQLHRDNRVRRNFHYTLNQRFCFLRASLLQQFKRLVELNLGHCTPLQLRKKSSLRNRNNGLLECKFRYVQPLRV